MARYIAFVDEHLEVRWYGGAEVNCYANGLEVGPASRGEWWSTKPTVAEVEQFANELLREGFASIE